MAPVAMMVGAVGLMTVWTAGVRHAASVPTATVLGGAVPATGRQTSAVEQAAARQSMALARLLADLGAPVQLSPPPVVALTRTAAQTVASLREAEAEMVSAADLDAQARLKAMQRTFRSTGLDARPYMATGAAGTGVSPLELRDSHVLAARLDVDAPLARQVQRAARDLVAARALGEASTSMPLAMPVDAPVFSSPFGDREDPFTHQIAFHPGQDFAGRYGDPIHVTAPGVVSFVGQRSGYGNCVEVDHGHGFKTRYGHLSGFTLGVGHVVAIGDVVGRMGSTGRSTGVHLHYEVWASGRLLDPRPFLNAGLATARSGA